MDRSQRAAVRFRVSTDVLAQELPGAELVFLHLRSEEYFGLDEVGARFWAVLSATGSVDEAHRELRDEYDVEPDRLRQDLDEFVGELMRHGLIEPDGQ